jgi:hypothetical protein
MSSFILSLKKETGNADCVSGTVPGAGIALTKADTVLALQVSITKMIKQIIASDFKHNSEEERGY